MYQKVLVDLVIIGIALYLTLGFHAISAVQKQIGFDNIIKVHKARIVVSSIAALYVCVLSGLISVFKLAWDYAFILV